MVSTTQYNTTARVGGPVVSSRETAILRPAADFIIQHL
jgi:hypothetical protein